MRKLPHTLGAILGAAAFTSCAELAAHSPTIDVLGSYFPAWMVCILVGIVLSTITRLVLIGCGIHEHLRLRTIVYLCLATVYTTLTWLLFYRN